MILEKKQKISESHKKKGLHYHVKLHDQIEIFLYNPMTQNKLYVLLQIIHSYFEYLLNILEVFFDNSQNQIL